MIDILFNEKELTNKNTVSLMDILVNNISKHDFLYKNLFDNIPKISSHYDWDIICFVSHMIFCIPFRIY